MTPDIADIARRLRQTRANMLGTEDEDHYWDCHEAAAEIERLRLTDAERQAIDWAAYAAEQWYEHTAAETLRGLLERMSGNGDCRGADNPTIQDNPDRSKPIAKCEPDSPQAIADARLAALQALAELDEELGLPRTPNPPSTPAKCSVPTGCIEGGGK
jgi:hypothetical protein